MENFGNGRIGELLIMTIVFMLPAYIANMFPVLWAKFPGVKKLFGIPLDGGKSWGKKRILGDHKTLGGLITGVLGGMIGGIIVLILANYGIGFKLFNVFSWQNMLSALIFGAVMGLGAILGDSLKSFFKRRMGIASGKAWPFFDQVDFVIGAWIASWLVTGLDFAFEVNGTWTYFVTALIITPLLHLLSNIVAYKLGLKKVWW